MDLKVQDKECWNEVTSNSSYKGVSYLDVNSLKKRINDDAISKESRRRARRQLAILKKHNFCCDGCGNKDYLTIDHLRKDFRYYNASAYSNSRFCEVLCVDCHLKKNSQKEEAR